MMTTYKFQFDLFVLLSRLGLACVF
jgi:hypothetical protein